MKGIKELLIEEEEKEDIEQESMCRRNGGYWSWRLNEITMILRLYE